MLLWISTTSNSEYAMVYVAISLITLGRAGGSKVLQDFFYYQLNEEFRAKKERKPQHENTDNERKEDHDAIILWQLSLWCFGYAITVAFSVFVIHPRQYFRFAALFMGVTDLLFYFGYAWYSHEKLTAESNLGKIYRILKAAYRKRKFRYPTSENEYYRKTYEQHHFYKAKHALRLLPQVPLLGWLDKAAIVKGQETKREELCTVKEVREVKSVALLIFWGFTFFAYSLVVASGNTFFVGQASNLRTVYYGNDIPLLFVLKSTLRDVLLLFCKHIGVAFKIMSKVKVTNNWVLINFGFKRIDATIIRIGAGMSCALICCVVAWRVEVHRLCLIEKESILRNPNRNISMSTWALVPQFSLLGITEGLAEGGLKDLFHGYASKSMLTFDESFSQLVIGTGKLLTIPCVLIFRRWIKESANTSHLERYFLVLAVLNFVFLLGFAYYSFKYAWKKEYLDDEEIMVEQRLQHAHQADLEEANANAENSAISEGPMVAKGDSYQNSNEIVAA